MILTIEDKKVKVNCSVGAMSCYKNILKNKLLVLLLLGATILMGSIVPGRASADDYPMVLTIVNHSGFDDSQIYLLCTGSNQPGNEADKHFGYLDFARKQFVETGEKGDFELNTATMTTTLSSVKDSASNTYKIYVPEMVSGRFYFAFGDNFSAFSGSGPPNGRNNTVVYDKVEFDTWDNPNINTTNVDFFGISYYVTATDKNTGQKVSRGFTVSRDSIFTAFKNIATNEFQHNGNTAIFDALNITRPSKNDVDDVRILAPKNAGYTDFSPTLEDAAQKSSHFFDLYINNHCWKPNRTFSFYSKLYKPSDPAFNNTVYYGRVSDDGMTLYLFTDKNMTVPYIIPSLPRPSSSDFLFPGPTGWHNVNGTDSDQIDWGFLLGGQSGGTGNGANWASDPVAMAILISIARGVMHYDDGCVKWTDSNYYYSGDSGISTPDYPIYYYGKLLHNLSINKLNYSLSYDDIYANDPSVYFNGHPDVTLTFNSVKPTQEATLSVNPMNLYVGSDAGSISFDIKNSGTIGTVLDWKAQVVFGGDWLKIPSGSSGTNDGTVVCEFDKNANTDFRTGVVRVTADGIAGSPVDIPLTQSPVSSACTSTLDNNLLLHIPNLLSAEASLAQIALWADLIYEYNPMYPGLLIFKLKDFGSVDNPSFNCSAPTIAKDAKIHIPDLLLPDGTTHLWVDLEFVPSFSEDNNIFFVISNFG